MTVPDDFDTEVYAVIAEIPAGRVVTYGQIARLVGTPGLARRVGRALTNAPTETPCHRVVNHKGRTAPGWSEQRTLLEAEAVEFRADGCVDIARFCWEQIH